MTLIPYAIGVLLFCCFLCLFRIGTGPTLVAVLQDNVGVQAHEQQGHKQRQEPEGSLPESHAYIVFHHQPNISHLVCLS